MNPTHHIHNPLAVLIVFTMIVSLALLLPAVASAFTVSKTTSTATVTKTTTSLSVSAGSYLDSLSPPATCPYSGAPLGNTNGATLSPPRPVSSNTNVDYSAVRAALKNIMDNPSWDDGSLAPIFIRLAWHSSGTYDAASGTGGSNGAGMRFATEAADPENAGLNVARSFLEPIKKQFPEISYSDLWILAAYGE